MDYDVDAPSQDAMWQMNLRSSETMEPGPYPERAGETDCSYYIRTGFCRFDSTCRFNHPPNRKLAIAAARMKGEFPERVGQPECQYYLKTGTCKFGATCKFHHPRDKAGIAERVALNILGYPLRPGEPLCIFYSRYGICKFGPSCKFDHPMGIFTYNLAVSSSAESPAGRLLDSKSGTTSLNLSSDGLVEAGSTNPRRITLSEPRQMPSAEEETDTEE